MNKSYHGDRSPERIQIDQELDARGLEHALSLALLCAQRARLDGLVTDLTLLLHAAKGSRRAIEAGARV